MKTLVFFHREQLTDLFIGLAQHMGDQINTIHVAYGPKEVCRLEKAGITTYYNYTQITDALFDQIQSADPAIIEQIDKLLLKHTGGRFNLNTSLQSDRGFSVLTYQQALISAQVHYLAWGSIFEQHPVDFLLHEPCSLFFNHIASAMCAAQGGKFVWQAMTPPEGDQITYMNIVNDDYTCPEISYWLDYYLQNPDKIDRTRCNDFLVRYRANYEVMFSNMIMKFSRNKLRYFKFRKFVGRIIKPRKIDILKDNINYWLNAQDPSGEKLANLKAYEKQKIHFELPVDGERYYYYSFHLEPEAVVLYLGDGIYTNQIKLIENIAAALPAGCFLYVKDHPHELAYRSAEDYLRLTRVPNIRLIQSSISGKSLIKNAIGVFSINGTAGFEALMLGKQVYNFGKSYYTYCNRVNHVLNIRDLRQQLYDNRNVAYTDDDLFLAYLNAYLDSMHVGMVDFFMDRAKTYAVDLERNAQQIAADFITFTNKF